MGASRAVILEQFIHKLQICKTTKTVNAPFNYSVMTQFAINYVTIDSRNMITQRPCTLRHFIT